MLAARPGSVRAHVGAGRVALARGDAAEARGHFDAALAADPDSAGAQLGLADLAERAGDPSQTARWLRAVLRGDARRADVHERLATLTGLAPPAPADLPTDERLRLARAHPYDTRALLAVADALVRDGKPGLALRFYQRILWLGDLHPPSTVRALRSLRALSPVWRDRAIVEVHSYADEPVRARPGWRFSVRDAWRMVSQSLSEVIDVRFVPISISAFESAGVSVGLDEIHEAVRLRALPAPAHGIIAGFTGREPPRVAGVAWKRGIAQLLGRRVSVRLPEGAVPVRVLAHEILHLYGAIHVADELPSLMNRGGHEMGLDPFNARIVRATRARRFAAGDPERDVLPYVDRHETAEAYLAALRANLTLRSAGLDTALASARQSRFLALGQLREARALDPHLADMTGFVARLLLAEGRRVEAVLLLEASGQLYGPRSPRGRAALKRARRLRRALEAELR